MSGSVVDVNVHCHIDKARVGTGGGVGDTVGTVRHLVDGQLGSGELANQNFSKMVDWDDVTCGLMYRRKHTK